MDSHEQASGEKRVRQVLVDPLIRRGLAKPSSLTKLQFEDMVSDLCSRLAYMSEANLMALEEQVASNPGGKDKDRMPIAQRILEWAALIQPPGDDASPLFRAVFASQLGLDALSAGWAPELLAQLRKPPRCWPNAWVVKTVKEAADPAVRQLRDIEARLARGAEINPSEEQWRARRLATIAKCQQIADMAKGKEGEAV